MSTIDISEQNAAASIVQIVAVCVYVCVSLGVSAFDIRLAKRNGRVIIGAGTCAACKGGRRKAVGENLRVPALEEDRK